MDGLGTSAVIPATQALEAPIPKRAPSPYEIETKLKAIDRGLEIIRHDLEAIDKKGPQLCSNSWNGFRNRAAPFEYRDALIAYRNQVRERALELEGWRSQIPHYPDLARISEPTWVQDLISATDNFIATYGALHTYLREDVPSDVFAHLMGHRVFAFDKANHAFSWWRQQTIKAYIQLTRTNIGALVGVRRSLLSRSIRPCLRQRVAGASATTCILNENAPVN